MIERHVFLEDHDNVLNRSRRIGGVRRGRDSE